MKDYTINQEMKEIKYTIYEKEDFKNIDNFNFFLQDIGYTLIKESKFPTILYIEEIFVDKNHRNKNIGSELLQQIINDNKDKLILVTSYLSKKEFLEKPTNEKYNEILTKLSHFFEINGFININKHFGQYEFKETFIYNNDMSQKYILKHIN